ncbi:metallophosphoesterase [Flavivirga amylovorans]|uniref:Metallophosphoesterase n=1 Tax=Flavivirga amylovorans TaxID=870486 RepID=A0ABT8X0S3_9FLAO|nr:metallophosphoesterase [Flavivirga amylovorans]MDO5987538.1 metallophosphoesterase [Flavivirga amylovorans]
MMRSIIKFICITFLVQNLIAQNVVSDGPYLFNEDGKQMIYSIIDGQLSKETLPENRIMTSFQVATDIKGESFQVWLKPGLSYELATYHMPNKLVAISDIEGNFAPLRLLLQSTGVIDNDLKWSFGSGHLVLTGDFFDRGNQVTEVLWLIYKLEWEAQEAGGHVHFILGNHEIMNLRGDLRYVHDKYQQSAKLMGKELIDLYGANTELGQWLRTKNIAEKIGNHLFVHGGISETINKLDVSLMSMSNLARPFYDRETGYDKIEEILLSGQGPLWYRRYYNTYKGKPITEDIIDCTLKKFEVSKIITGHTVIDKGEKITTHYSGKVINIDTHHAAGKSEALLIQSGNYYRLNINGEKQALFKK